MKQIKKRLRKKFHIMEFTEYGVDFELKFTGDLPLDQFEKLVDSFVIEFLESRKLCGCGGWDPDEKGIYMVIETGRKRELADKCAAEIQDWFKQRNVQFEYTFTIVDLWNGDE